MALARLTLNTELAPNWRTILAKSGVEAICDQVTETKTEDDGPSKHLVDTAWRLSKEGREVRAVEIVYLDHRSNEVLLVFMPGLDTDLFRRVWQTLVAAGATDGRKKSKQPPIDAA